MEKITITGNIQKKRTNHERESDWLNVSDSWMTYFVCCYQTFSSFH